MLDIIVEIFLEVYMELMLLIVPSKNATKKHLFFAKLIAIIALLGVFALIIYGAILVFDYNNLWGLIPLALALIISIIQIVLGIILYKKHH